MATSVNKVRGLALVVQDDDVPLCPSVGMPCALVDKMRHEACNTQRHRASSLRRGLTSVRAAAGGPRDDSERDRRESVDESAAQQKAGRQLPDRAPLGRILHGEPRVFEARQPDPAHLSRCSQCRCSLQPSVHPTHEPPHPIRLPCLESAAVADGCRAVRQVVDTLIRSVEHDVTQYSDTALANLLRTLCDIPGDSPRCCSTALVATMILCWFGSRELAGAALSVPNLHVTLGLQGSWSLCARPRQVQPPPVCLLLSKAWLHSMRKRGSARSTWIGARRCVGARTQSKRSSRNPFRSRH